MGRHMSTTKPIVVYLHRYPPEIEAFQWPGMREVVGALAPVYELVYASMKPAAWARNDDLRRDLTMLEAPLAIDQADGRDKWIKTLRWYGYLGRMLERVRALNPAVVICQEALPWIPGQVAALGFPTLIATADWWWSILLGDTRPGRWLAGRLEVRDVRSWNRPNVRATVCTEAGRRLLAARGLQADKIDLVNMPRNPGMFRPLDPRPTKAELGLEPGLKHVALFGIIRRGKGYEQLLGWWRGVAAKHPDWRLVIIGGGEGEGWCRREIRRLGLDGVVEMTGWIETKQEVNRRLNAMDALLVPRRNSPDNQGAIPSALFNGLSTERPVVATGLPSIAEVVRDGVDGFLYRPDDEESFRGALEQALGDPEGAAAVGRAGHARAAECFDPAKVGRTYRRLVDRLAQMGRPEGAKPETAGAGGAGLAGC